jgi:biotin-[acetyl-CoA-carboxylase] ligase BirA-like protein
MMIKYLEVGSTMDTAKDLLNGKEQVPSAFSHVSIDADVFAVVADYQNQGRGTRGRTWTSASGNMYMTLVVKMDKVGIPLTLVPLRMGTLIAPSIRSRVCPSSENVYLKWPNDVLIGDRKVCGTLIEIENGRLLVGIGCNVAEAPVVPDAGADKGRSSTSIQEHAREGEQHDATAIAAEIIQATKDWLSSRDSAEYVVNDFESAMAKGAVQTLRNGPDEGKQVIPLRINPDGTLHVKFASSAVDGAFLGERTLIADYLV